MDYYEKAMNDHYTKGTVWPTALGPMTASQTILSTTFQAHCLSVFIGLCLTGNILLQG